MTPRRPIIRYHGGKWRLAPWIISHFPEHRIYVEPYGGGGSVLLRKPRSYAEVYNDMDGEIVNVFRMARERGAELKEQLRLTPFSREDFKLSFFHTDDLLEQARRTIARSFMGLGSAAATMNKNTRGRSTAGFRANSNRSGTTPAHDWRNYTEAFDAIIERLRGIVIENRPAIQVMASHDSPETLHYVDPPYVTSTRDDKRADYRHEMTNDDHVELAKYLKTVKGQVILSGYKSELYGDLYSSWKFFDKAAFADGAKKRTERLWLSPGLRENWVIRRGFRMTPTTQRARDG